MLPVKQQVQRAFAVASVTYDQAAQLQRQVGTELLAVAALPSLSGRVLDIGCGTRFLAQALLAATDAEVVALDLALPMLHTARHKLSACPGVHYVCADAEALPFAEASFDVVVSNLALQWCADVAAVFHAVRPILRPGGRLLFSTFGIDTLQELKCAWAAVDQHQHVNEFLDETVLSRLLRQAGLTVVRSQRRIYRPQYASVRAVLRELKQLGAQRVLSGRNPQVTSKGALQRMMAAYSGVLPDGTVTATFDVIWFEICV